MSELGLTQEDGVPTDCVVNFDNLAHPGLGHSGVVGALVKAIVRPADDLATCLRP